MVKESSRGVERGLRVEKGIDEMGSRVVVWKRRKRKEREVDVGRLGEARVRRVTCMLYGCVNEENCDKMYTIV